MVTGGLYPLSLSLVGTDEWSHHLNIIAGIGAERRM